MTGSDLAADYRPRLLRGVRLKEDLARGTTVLLSPERVLMPSPTAIAVLELCDGRNTVEAIIDALSGAYEADRERIATDVRRLLHDLQARRILAP